MFSRVASRRLSVMDYVHAHEQGFGDRSDAYIAARLDLKDAESERIDLRREGKACGQSHIPKNKKCSKRTTVAASSQRKKNKGKRRLTEKQKRERREALLAAGAAALYVGASVAQIVSEERTRRRKTREWEEQTKRYRAASQAARNARKGFENQEWAKTNYRRAKYNTNRQRPGGGGQRAGAEEASRQRAREAAQQSRKVAQVSKPERVTRNYSLLGIKFKYTGKERPPSAADTKTAWKRAARKNHPDMGGSAEKMAEVNNAYDEINMFRDWWESQNGGRTDAAEWDVGPKWQWARKVR